LGLIFKLKLIDTPNNLFDLILQFYSQHESKTTL